jgi:hypothetical protein
LLQFGLDGLRHLIVGAQPKDDLPAVVAAKPQLVVSLPIRPQLLINAALAGE